MHSAEVMKKRLSFCIWVAFVVLVCMAIPATAHLNDDDATIFSAPSDSITNDNNLNESRIEIDSGIADGSYLQIKVSGIAAATSIQFDLMYDPVIVTISGIRRGVGYEGVSMTTNINVAGTARVLVIFPDPLTIQEPSGVVEVAFSSVTAGTSTLALENSRWSDFPALASNNFDNVSFGIIMSIITPTPTPTPIPTPPPPTPIDTITLSPGWNFISIPKRLVDGNNTASIFADVDTGGRSLFLYNTPTKTWEIMTPSSQVKPLDAIWIYANQTTSIPLDFDSGAVQAPPSKQLYEGWNAIGLSSTIPVTARDTLITVSPKWGQLLGWNAVTQSYHTAIIRGGSGVFTDSREMQPMQGYWVAMTDSGVLYALS